MAENFSPESTRAESIKSEVGDLVRKLDEMNKNSLAIVEEIRKSADKEDKETNAKVDAFLSKILGSMDKNFSGSGAPGASELSSLLRSLGSVGSFFTNMLTQIQDAIGKGFREAGRVIQGGRDQVTGIAQANALAGTPLTPDQTRDLLNVAERANIVKANAARDVELASQTGFEKLTLKSTRESISQVARDVLYTGVGLDSDRAKNLAEVERFEEESRKSMRNSKSIYKNYSANEK